MHDNQDYTVIIKWKNWYALEDEEIDTPLERKRKQAWGVFLLDDQDAEDLVDRKKMKLSTAILDHKRLSPQRGKSCVSVGSSELLGQLPKDMEIVLDKKRGHEEMHDWIGQKPSPDNVKLIDYTVGYSGSEEEVTNKQGSVGRNTSLSKSSYDQVIPGGSKDMRHSSAGSQLNSYQTLHKLTTPQLPAYEIHNTSSHEDKVTWAEVKSLQAGVKSSLVEEGNEAVITLGKADVSDKRAIHEKSSNINFHVKPMWDATQRLPFVEHGRPTKRMRGSKKTTYGHEGTVVVCPVCELEFSGNPNDTDFNSQINLHVDCCIRAAK